MFHRTSWMSLTIPNLQQYQLLTETTTYYEVKEDMTREREWEGRIRMMTRTNEILYDGREKDNRLGFIGIGVCCDGGWSSVL